MNAEAHARRLTQLRERLTDQALGGFIVSHLPNVRYLTGFTGSAAVVLVTQTEAVLFTDFRYAEQSEQEVARGVRVEIVGRHVMERVMGAADGRRLEQVGFEAHNLSVRAAEKLQENGGRSRYQPTEDVIEAIRTVKDEGEVDAVRRAAQLAHAALKPVLEWVAPGQSEIEIAARLEFELRVRGSEWHPFQTIVASGPRSAQPHATTSDRVLAPGEWLLLDFGAQVDGYCADITRTVVVGGRADERQQMVYGLVRDAQRTAREGIRGGMTGREADGLARSMIDAKGFADAFGHSLGHGLGLEVHEAPRVSHVNDEPIPTGAVVTVEPGVYFPGWGGVRIEDDVHVTDVGGVLLSDGLTDLLEIV